MRIILKKKFNKLIKNDQHFEKQIDHQNRISQTHKPNEIESQSAKGYPPPFTTVRGALVRGGPRMKSSRPRFISGALIAARKG